METEQTQSPELAIEWLEAKYKAHAEQFGKKSATLLELILSTQMYIKGMQAILEDHYEVLEVMSIQAASAVSAAATLADFKQDHLDFLMKTADVWATDFQTIAGDVFVMSGGTTACQTTQ